MSTKEILEKYKKIAVVGLSNKPEAASFRVANYLKDNGYDVVGVHPTNTEVAGIKCYPALLAIPNKVEIVDVFLREDRIPLVAQQAVEHGAKVLWLQLELFSEEAQKIASEANLEFVVNRCTKIEHSKYFK